MKQAIILLIHKDVKQAERLINYQWLVEISAK